MKEEGRGNKKKVPEGFRRATVATPKGEIVEYGPEAILSDHATRFMIDHMAVPPGTRVAEAGCGTGVLSIYAALAGATEVTGTDIDDDALEAARLNGRMNRVDHVRFLKGSLLEPVPGPLDLVLALLPHKPGPRPFNRRYYGGEEGVDLLLPAVGQAAERLVRGGVLYLYLNSIANEVRVMELFTRLFHVSLVAEKRRPFTREEFEGLVPGMMEHLRALKVQERSAFGEDEKGLYFMARIYEGRRR